MHHYTWHKSIQSALLITGSLLLSISLAGCRRLSEDSLPPNKEADKVADKVATKSTPKRSSGNGQLSSSADPGGIPNVGNTCYMNSIMQVIAKLSPEIFPGRGQVGQLELGRTGKVIIDKIKEDQHIVTRKEAQAFFDAFTSNGDWPPNEGSKYSQQDAHEAYEQLLKLLKAPESHKTHFRTYYSDTQETITSKHKEQDYTKPVYDPAIGILGIDFNSNASKLQEHLDNYFAAEDFEPDAKRQGNMTPIIGDPAVILPVFARRFQDTGAGTMKQEKSVQEPFSLIIKKSYQDLKDGSQLSDIKYTLAAFVHHSGATLAGGHYTAYIKRNGTWKHYNDSNVNDVGGDDDVKRAAEKAYLYFFRRVP